MIESFVVVCANGITHIPGVFPLEIPIMDFFNPEYQRAQYEWRANGVTYTRKCDVIETCSMELTLNKKYLVVEQSPSKYGSDSLLVLNPDGTEYRRPINPYRTSPEYQDGDEFEFIPNFPLGRFYLLEKLISISFQKETTIAI